MSRLRIVYSFNKRGFEADSWTREIRAARTPEYEFIPFNHDPFLDPSSYVRAQLLDNLYFEKHDGLLRLYAAVGETLRETSAQALLVDNCFPYHPEFLRTLRVYKVLRTTDGPVSAYDRDFAYLHAYDHVLYHSPAYSRDLSMAEKLAYCGAKRADLWPLGLFDSAWDTTKTDATILAGRRDLDVVFVGALHPGKMPLLARVKKALGRRFRFRGVASLKKNVYFNLRYGLPGWVRPIRFDEYIPLYQRAKIGINVHNRGEYTVGNYRLFELPANGVMQISDGGPWLERFFKPGEEIAPYEGADDLIDKLRYYLSHEAEREGMARRAFRRVTSEHRMHSRMGEAAELIRLGMRQTGEPGSAR